MVNFCMLYWDMGCEVRRQNTIIAWKELKKMSKYLVSRGLNFNSFLFEFGDKYLFDDSIKISQKLEYYEKSKKNNLIINNIVNKNSRFIAIIDSDLFFSENQYDMMYNHIIEIEENNKKYFFTYNLLDINENERKEIIDFEKIELKKEKIKEYESKFIWRHSFGAGVLGGFFLCPLKELKDMGGFDENFLTWGAEDDDAHKRMKEYCQWIPKMNQGPYHLWHPKNENDKKYYIPVYSEEYFKINKVKKP